MFLVINLTDDYANAYIIKNKNGTNEVFDSWDDAATEQSNYEDAVIVDTTG